MDNTKAQKFFEGHLIDVLAEIHETDANKILKTAVYMSRVGNLTLAESLKIMSEPTNSISSKKLARLTEPDDILIEYMIY